MEALMTQNIAGPMLNVNHAITSGQPGLPRRMGSDGGGRLDLSIVGLGTQYPSNKLGSNVMATLAKRHYRDSPAMRKVLSIFQNTGIEHPSSIVSLDHPLLNQEDAPWISQLHRIFVSDGVPLALDAAQAALQEAQLDKSQITHLMCATNTDSGSPSLDTLLQNGLGITAPIEKTFLHGVGGFGLLRAGANIALACTAMGEPARVLCVALDVNTTMLRSELDTVDEQQETRVGSCLFADGASALVLSNGVGDAPMPVFELLRYTQETLPDTQEDFGFDVHETGWKPRVSIRVPELISEAVAPAFKGFLGMPQLRGDLPHPAKFDWAVEPFCGPVLSGVEESLEITAEHLRASYETYNKHGHCGSAAVFSVLDRLRSKDMDAMTSRGQGRDYIIGFSFSPGIVMDMCMLRRYKSSGRTRSGAPLESRKRSETSTTTTSGESLGDHGRDTPARGHMTDALKSLDLDYME